MVNEAWPRAWAIFKDVLIENRRIIILHWEYFNRIEMTDRCCCKSSGSDENKKNKPYEMSLRHQMRKSSIAEGSSDQYQYWCIMTIKSIDSSTLADLSLGRQSSLSRSIKWWNASNKSLKLSYLLSKRALFSNSIYSVLLVLSKSLLFRK